MTVDETLKLIAQQWCNLSDLMKLANMSEEEIYKKYNVIVKLLDYKPLKNKIILDKLYGYNIVENKSGPRPFQCISKKDAEILLNEGMSDE